MHNSCLVMIDDAYCFFMKDAKAKYYEKNAKYYEKHPRGRIMPEELRGVIMQKWRDMSDADKAPYVECAEELRAQGLTYLVCTTAVWSVIDDAYCLFMKDSKAKYCEKQSQREIMSEDLGEAIMQEWMDMSDADKAPYVERAEELRAQGLTYLD
ncbi:uncharacterized protein LOC108201989 isoform X3 [Daucus carota subsp. sativus]|uniref:uncharacterized protein LOC108201989 isoform X3 n=1 Tax=Daucus carota subsp. sativus TaxID=79200 RepID=UPI0007EF91EA|nr:PREDICTED: uncharacterized protein LOC108201989 isoform X3 [Daucus carota subsp. sativus]